jgi:hypothetical protein
MCKVTGINTRDGRFLQKFKISRSGSDDDVGFERCGTINELKRYGISKECFRNKINNYKRIYTQKSQTHLHNAQASSHTNLQLQSQH